MDNEYLSATKCCDWEHPAIRRVACDLVSGSSSEHRNFRDSDAGLGGVRGKESACPRGVTGSEATARGVRTPMEVTPSGVILEREKAVAIFDFVREKIKYRFDYPATKASETLAKGLGNCFNKANLQIALLRSLGIPAGYQISLIHKEVFQPLVPPEVYELISQPTIHCLACVFMENNWIPADATIDKEVFDAVYRGRQGWQYGNWDGVQPYSLNQRFVIENQGVYACLDLFLLTPARFWNDELLARTNAYLENLLKNPPCPGG